MRVLKTTALILSLGASTLQAASSPHVVGGADLQAAIAHRNDEVASQRAAIQSVLSRPEVQHWATSAGLDLERARAAASTLEGEELQRLASQARQADAQLAGGDAVVIGTTTIVIILLVVILLLVA